MPIPVDFEPVLSVPYWGERLFGHWPEEERAAYGQLAEPRVVDQVGGWPFELQGDPTPEVAWRGGFPPEPDEVARWNLLVQLETTPGDHMWADGGIAWFMGEGDALAEGRFDDVRSEIASH